MRNKGKTAGGGSKDREPDHLYVERTMQSFLAEVNRLRNARESCVIRFGVKIEEGKVVDCRTFSDTEHLRVELS